MANYKNEVSGEMTDSYLLVGEKQGVSADQWAELGDIVEEHIILADTVEELADERVSSLPAKNASSES